MYILMCICACMCCVHMIAYMWACCACVCVPVCVYHRMCQHNKEGIMYVHVCTYMCSKRIYVRCMRICGKLPWGYAIENVNVMARKARKEIKSAKRRLAV